MPQGWAGSRPTGEDWKCALCLNFDHAFRPAITIIGGTAVCQHHAGWILVPVTPPPGNDAA